MVEAAGVEPASWSERQPSVYVRSPRFKSRPWVARGRAIRGPAPPEVSPGRREALFAGQPAVYVPLRPRAIPGGTAAS